MAVNLLPANVPIGYVNNDPNLPIYASPELTRALTNMMLQIGGQSSASPGDVTNLTAIGIEHGIRISGTLPTPTPDDIEVWSSADNILAHAVLQTHGLLSSWDWIGLTSADGIKYIWVRTVFKSGKKGNFVGPVSAEAGINTIPNPVTGLTATPIIGGIRISGTLPADIDLAGVEIWENTVNNVNTATKLDQGKASSYDRLNLLASAGTRYYWVRSYNTSGARGVFVGPVSATAGTADWQTQVSGTGKPADFADVTTSILSNSGTTVTMTSSNLFKTTTGVGGVFIGGGGITGKDSGGNVTFALDGSTGAASFAGNITGGANLNITGQATFGGNFAQGGFSAAATANNGGVSQNGFVGWSTASPNAGTVEGGVVGVGQGTSATQGTAGVVGITSVGTKNCGVYGLIQGSATGGWGVYGYAVSGCVGVRAENASAGGLALQVVGTMSITSSTLVTNLNADQVDGHHASDFALQTSVAKALIYQTTVTPSSTAVAGYIKVLSTDGTVGPVAIPFCNLP